MHSQRYTVDVSSSEQIDDIISNSSPDIHQSALHQTNLNQWTRFLHNISVIALQKLSSQSIGILSEKQIISLNVKTLKIEHKIKPARNSTCIAIFNSQQQRMPSSHASSFIKPTKQKKSGKSLQFLTGHIDGTITMWNASNKKIKQMKVFQDSDASNRRPVNCINIITQCQYQPNQSNLQSSRHAHINDPMRKLKKDYFSQGQITPRRNKVTYFVLLSGHSNGNVKQWNISTGQCLKEIETKNILFCLNLIQNQLQSDENDTFIEFREDQQGSQRRGEVIKNQQNQTRIEKHSLPAKQKEFKLIHKGILGKPIMKHKDEVLNNGLKRKYSDHTDNNQGMNRVANFQFNYKLGETNHIDKDNNNTHNLDGIHPLNSFSDRIHDKSIQSGQQNNCFSSKEAK